MTSEWPINCDNLINHRFESGHQKRGEYAKIAALTQPALGSDASYSGSIVRFYDERRRPRRPRRSSPPALLIFTSAQAVPSAAVMAASSNGRLGTATNDFHTHIARKHRIISH